MKKRGLTLVEMVAGMAILSLVLVIIYGIYIIGIQKIDETKSNATIENNYRKIYQRLNETASQSSDIKIINKKLTMDSSSISRDNNVDLIADKVLLDFKMENKFKFLISFTNKKNGLKEIFLVTSKKNIKDTDKIIIENPQNIELISDRVNGISFEKLGNDNINISINIKCKNKSREYLFAIVYNNIRIINIDEEKNINENNKS